MRIIQPAWVARANCADNSPELFYPKTSANPAQVRMAKRVCARCPVIDDCLAWALENERWGIWGGYTARERIVLKNGGNVRHQPRRVAS